MTARRTTPDACDRKRAYSSEDAAKQAMRLTRRSFGGRLRPYRCNVNPNHWHIGGREGRDLNHRGWV